jgi:hypothetical protein
LADWVISSNWVLAQFLTTQLIPTPEVELEILVESKSEQLTVPKPPPRLSKLSKGKAWVSRAESGKEVILLSSGHTLATVLCDFWDYCGDLVSKLLGASLHSQVRSYFIINK